MAGSAYVLVAAALLLGGLSGTIAPEGAPTRPAQLSVEQADATRSDMVGVGSHLLDAPSIERLLDLGVRHVRTTLYWSHWGDRSYRRTFAAQLRNAVAAGLEPLIVVHAQPSGGYENREEVYRRFATFMAARAAEFPEVRYWQLWNEMDVSFTDVFGARRPDVSLEQRGRNYARMLSHAYPAIKAANPGAVVVSGGIASAIDGGFLEGMYAGQARYDVLAIHTYGFPITGPFRDRGMTARRIMRQHGDSRPLWNTEFGTEAAAVAPGWPNSRADIDGYHLDAWREAVQGNSETGIYDRIYGHVLYQDGDLSFDLIRRDGSPRPAYVWLRSWLGQGS